MHLFQGALDTPLDSPLSATLSIHGLHFTVCAPSIYVLQSCLCCVFDLFWVLLPLDLHPKQIQKTDIHVMDVLSLTSTEIATLSVD